MIYPGYLLNPGDLFQVEPDRVMFATGKAKDPGTGKVKSQAGESGESDSQAEAQAVEEKEPEESAAEQTKSSDEENAPEEDPRETLKSLLTQAKGLLSSVPDKVPGKRKQDVRAFQRAVKRTLSKSKTSTILTDSLEAQFLELKNILKVPDQLPEKSQDKSKEEADQEKKQEEVNKDPNASSDTAESSASTDRVKFDMDSLTDSDIRALHRAMSLLRDNPIDPAKPYATPWSPRDFMSAFAFIPRYLEVNQNICAAVYLRHPVARPGLAEVPSPYNESTQGEAFAWYLRRR